MSQKLKIFSVYDKKALAYMNPFYYQQKGQAIRAFQDAVNDQNSPFFKHAEDFALYEIGEFDDRAGVINSGAVPVFVEEALNVKN